MEANRISVPRLATIVAVAAVLYIARDVFLPLAVAMLLAFAMSPPVRVLRHRGVPHLAAVLIVAAMAAVVIGVFFVIVATDISQLLRDLPTFQANILKKFDALQAAGSSDGVISRLSRMVAAISANLSEATATGGTQSAAPTRVEVMSQGGPFSVFQAVALTLFSPVATVGLVVILVVFMLLEQEELRDKFIRLVGSGDMHRTTQVLAEAGDRVGQYLLFQVLVNVIYAVPIGLGLWLIGVPNAVLWGMLTLVLRFVPFIGAFLAALFPVALAFAVSPDWSAVLWTVALFVSVEAVTSNVIEPWLYASHTGVSPLSIIISAMFWTLIWGPMGLVMAMPLTVCLVVLGRHVPQFELFYLLLGGEPVLAPYAGLYQRLLAGDAPEVISRAEEALETTYLADYYQDVGIPALLLGQNDFGLGSMTSDQQERLAGVAMHMIEELSPIVQEERDETNVPGEIADPDEIQKPDSRGRGYRISSFGGRSRIDDVAAAMLAQVLQTEGAEARLHSSRDLAASRAQTLDLTGQDCVILNFLDPTPSRASLLQIRRLKRSAPGLRIGVVIWAMPSDQSVGFDSAPGPAPVSQEKLAEATEIGADFVVTDMAGALTRAFSTEPALRLPDMPGRQLKVRPLKA